jgi:hypothetical protein
VVAGRAAPAAAAAAAAAADAAGAVDNSNNAPFQRGRSDLDEAEFADARHDAVGGASASSAALRPSRARATAAAPRASDAGGSHLSQPNSPPAQHAAARAVMAAAAAHSAQRKTTTQHLNGEDAAADEWHQQQQQQPAAAAQRPGSAAAGFLSGLLGGARRSAAAATAAAGPQEDDGEDDEEDRRYHQLRADSRLRRRRRRATAPAPLPEEAMHDELLTSAAIEFAVLSAARPSSRASPRAIHAPARRVARTVVCLGRADGLPLGALALRHVRGAAARARRSSDPSELAFWWSNACHLRGFLQSLSLAAAAAQAGGGGGGGGGGGDAPPGHWAAEALVPALLAQERLLFAEVAESAWSGALLPAVAARARAADRRSRAASPVADDGGAAALRRWADCLGEAARGLRALGGGGGHLPRLRALVLREVLRRVDALLACHLLLPLPPRDGEAAPAAAAAAAATTAASAAAAAALARGWRLGSLRPRSAAAAASAGPPAAAAAATSGGAVVDGATMPPPLSPAMLPWPTTTASAALTPLTGLALRAAADRLQQWALAPDDGGDGDGPGGGLGSEHEGAPLFPLMRGVADLLLLEPPMLRDPDARRAVLNALPADVAAAVAARYAPVVVVDDDDKGKDGAAAGDAPTAAALQALRREASASAAAAGGGGGGAPLAASLWPPAPAYASPSDDDVMASVEAGDEPGLEYDEDSEAELGALERLTQGGGGGGGGGAAGEEEEEEEAGWPLAAAAQPGPVLRFRLLHNLWCAGVPRAVRREGGA